MPLQGALLIATYTQGAALGYELLGLQPVPEPRAELRNLMGSILFYFVINKVYRYSDRPVVGKITFTCQCFKGFNIFYFEFVGA